MDSVSATSCADDPIVTGTAEFGATVHITGGAQEVITGADPYTARFSAPVPLGGNRTLTVTAVDAAGNESSPTTVEITDTDLAGMPAMIDLTTTPSPAAVTAGDTVDYTVVVTDSCGNTLSDALVDVTTNAPGAVAAAGTISGLTVAGNYRVVARVPGTNVVDSEPLTVDADASTAVVDLTLHTNLSSVGLPVGYSTRVVDGFGNPVPGTPTITVPTDSGATVDTVTQSITFSAAGTQTVTATLGSASDSELIVININDVLAPINVAITSPAAGTVYAPDNTVSVTVHAEDDIGLTQLAFQASGRANSFQIRLLPSGTTSTDQVFTFNIPGGANFGDIDLIAQATDGAGLTTTSAIVTIQVDPAKNIIVAGGLTIDTIAARGFLDRPRGIAVDNMGMVYVTNRGGGAPLVVKIDPALPVPSNQTSFVPPQIGRGEDIIFYDDPDIADPDVFFVSTSGGSDRIYRVSADGSVIEANWSPDVGAVPRGLIVDDVADRIACLYDDDRIRRFDPNLGPGNGVTSNMDVGFRNGGWGLELLNGGCPLGQFECGNGSCTNRANVCDGTDDCGDNSDEASCAGGGNYLCANLNTVSVGQICDGGDDCGDGSDEAGCRRYGAAFDTGGGEVWGFSDGGDTNPVIGTVRHGDNLDVPRGVAVSPSGLYVYATSQAGGDIYRMNLTGPPCGNACPIIATGFEEPWGLTFDASGNLLVTDYARDIVYRLSGSL